MCRAALLIGLLLAGFCANAHARRNEAVLHASLRGQLKSLDPGHGSLENERLVQAQIYEPLYEYHYLKRPYELRPLLAANLPTISKDGLTYTIPLKRGILFQDDPCFAGGKGRELVAEDFVYAWKRLADVHTRSDGSWIFEPVLAFDEWREVSENVPTAEDSRPLEGFQSLDHYTLQIRLKRPYPELVHVLAMVYTPPLPKECVEHYGSDFGKHATGTGPFRLRSWTPGSTVVLVRNPTFREERYPSEGSELDRNRGLLADADKRVPFLDRIVLKEMSDEALRFRAFMAGELDLIKLSRDNYEVYFDTSDPENLEQPVVRTAFAEKGFHGWHLPLLDLTYEAFNMQDPVVGGAKGKALRQAICLQRDYEKRNRGYYNGSALIAVSPIPPELEGYEPALPNPYRALNGDHEGALRLLRDAGIDPASTPELVYDTYAGPDAAEIAQNFADEVRALGFRIRIETSTWPEFNSKTRRRLAQMWGLSWGADYPAPENFLQLFYCPNASPGTNDTNYCNPVFDKLYEQAREMNPGPERTEHYRRMASLIIEDCPICPDMHRTRHYGNHQRLKNFRPDEAKDNLMKYWRVELGQGLGTLSVYCSQPDCEVLVDEKSVGRTREGQWLILEQVEAGEFEVELRKEGFAPHREALRLLPGATVRLQAALDPGSAAHTPSPSP